MEGIFKREEPFGLSRASGHIQEEEALRPESGKMWTIIDKIYEVHPWCQFFLNFSHLLYQFNITNNIWMMVYTRIISFIIEKTETMEGYMTWRLNIWNSAVCPRAHYITNIYNKANSFQTFLVSKFSSGLLKPRLLGHNPKALDSISKTLEICLSNKFSDDSDVPGLGTTLWRTTALSCVVL